MLDAQGLLLMGGFVAVYNYLGFRLADEPFGLPSGVAATLSGWLPLVLAGPVVLTAGFFGAHAVASGWTPVAAQQARTQAAAVYNLAYYAGSSVFGRLGGVGFALAGWPGTVGMVLALVAVAMGLAAAVLRD